MHISILDEPSYFVQSTHQVNPSLADFILNLYLFFWSNVIWHTEAVREGLMYSCFFLIWGQCQCSLPFSQNREHNPEIHVVIQEKSKTIGDCKPSPWWQGTWWWNPNQIGTIFCICRFDDQCTQHYSTIWKKLDQTKQTFIHIDIETDPIHPPLSDRGNDLNNRVYHGVYIGWNL